MTWKNWLTLAGSTGITAAVMYLTASRGENLKDALIGAALAAAAAIIHLFQEKPKATPPATDQSNPEAN
jgi:hypothetical protein